MRFSRFERKIVLAIAAVAIVPLVGALVFGRSALREAYAVGVNRQVGAQLDATLDLYRRHFAELREDADRTAKAVAHDNALCEALAERRHAERAPADAAEAVQVAIGGLLERFQNIAAVRVVAFDGVQFRRVRDTVIDPGPVRSLDIREPLGCPQGEVSVTVTTDLQPFRDYQVAGEVVEVYRALETASRYLSGYYVIVYVAFMLTVIMIALWVGIVLSRRVTRRVALLADATKRVGRGELDVEVPSDVRDEVGELTRAFNSMVHDLRESGERIEYLSRIGAWQDFARRLAHEIKNPLTPIQLAVQEAHRTYRGDDPRYQATLDEACAIVEEEIATLRRLVGEFSAFARLPQAALEEADLAEFLDDAVHLSALQEDLALEEGSLELRVIAPAGPLRVRIDGMMLKRCVDNLVRNAAQAMRDAPGQRDQGMVIIAARREGRSAVIEVRDNGPGIPEEARRRVFDPYYTTKREGTGLGLAIVKKIVLEHGGTVECHQANEGGACFRIILPLSKGRP